jgi:hypothetical protein
MSLLIFRGSIIMELNYVNDKKLVNDHHTEVTELHICYFF